MEGTEQPFKEEFEQYCREQGLILVADAYRCFGKELFQQELFQESLWYAEKVLELGEQDGTGINLADNIRAESCAYAAGDLQKAFFYAQRNIDARPDTPPYLVSAGLYNMLMANYKLAEKYYLRACELDPQYSNACEALAHLYDLMNQPEKVKQFGTKALKLKDAEAMDAGNMARLRKIIGNNFRLPPVPEFSPEDQKRNVISFSLWGEKEMYLEGAVLNAALSPVIYPGWSCRFYCSSTVPQSVFAKLIELGADVRMIEQTPRPYFGLFWRFLVACDPEVDRYLVRDCDCLLNCQERVAVDEWIRSGKHFHIMRDYASHTELIHAGMWGGVRGAIPDMIDLIADYYERAGKERTIDQRFLRHCIWPIVKQSHLCHDSIFNFGASKRFPPLGSYPAGTGNVGINWKYYYQELKIKPLLNF